MPVYSWRGMTAVLQASSLRKRFLPSQPYALDGLDLILETGSVLAVLGAVGAGKTTLLRLIAGLAQPDEGQIHIFGLEPVHDEARRRLALVPEAPEFPARLRPAEVMDLSGRLLGLARAEREGRALESLKWAGLEDERRPVGRLPAGRKKRLGLALALLGRPDLLLLDEPGAALDAGEQRSLRGLVRALRRTGSAVVICSRELGEVEAAADQALLLERGRALAAGPLAAIVPEGRSLARVFAELHQSERLAAQIVPTAAFPRAETE
jgi:ABC-type multidrug transport system ATPase subunit